ncbi:hypothetical protein [Peribacillus simplex]|uniref:hypothetical protein n=1 Tax=Peribacillus simplex TaxID=1478 RepID=UPI003D2A9CEA
MPSKHVAEFCCEKFKHFTFYWNAKHAFTYFTHASVCSFNDYSSADIPCHVNKHANGFLFERLPDEGWLLNVYS